MANAPRETYTLGDIEPRLARVPDKDRDGVRRWLQTKAAAGAAWNTVKTYTAGMERLGPLFAGPIATTDRDGLVAAMATIQGWTTPGWYVRTLRNYLAFHDREEVLKKLPKTGRRRRETMDPEKLLSREQVGRMVAACRDARDAALIGVTFDAGARIGSVLGLRIGDLVPHGKGKELVWTVWLDKDKIRGRERRLPLYESSPILSRYLASHPRRDDPLAPLFISKHRAHVGEWLSESSAREIMKRAAKLAGIEADVWPHLLRHSRSADFKRRKVSDEATIRWMGWSPESRQVRRYGPLKVEEAADEVASRLGYRPLAQPAPVKDLEALVVDVADPHGVEAKVEDAAKAYAEAAKRLEATNRKLEERLAHLEANRDDAVKRLLSDPAAMRALQKAFRGSA